MMNTISYLLLSLAAAALLAVTVSAVITDDVRSVEPSAHLCVESAKAYVGVSDIYLEVDVRAVMSFFDDVEVTSIKLVWPYGATVEMECSLPYQLSGSGEYHFSCVAGKPLDGTAGTPIVIVEYRDGRGTWTASGAVEVVEVAE